MRKTLLFISVLFAIALTLSVLFASPLLLSIAKWQLGRSSEELFGQRMVCTKVERKGRTLCFHTPTFYHQLSPNEGGAVVSAELLEIELRLQPIRRRWDLDIRVDSPRVQLIASDGKLPSLPWSVPKNRKRFTPSISIAVVNGRVDFYDLAREETALFPLDLFAQWSPSKAWRAHAQSDFGTLEADGDNLGLLVHYRVTPHNSPALLRLLQYTVGTPLEGIELCNGSLAGEGSAWLPSQGKPKIEGVVELSDLHFTSRSSRISGKIPALALHLSAREGSDNGSRNPTLLALWEHCSGEILLPNPCSIKGRAGLADQKWKVDVDEGNFQLQSDCLSGTLLGTLKVGDSRLPLVAEGEMHFGPQCQIAVEMGWPAQLAGPLAPHCHLDWTPIGRKSSYLDLELVRIGREQALLLQSLATCFIPQASQLQLDVAEISSRTQIRFEQHRPYEVRVDSFTLRDLTFAYAPHNTSGSIALARGALSHRVSASSPLSALSGWMGIDGGNLCLLNRHTFEEIDGELRLLNGRLVRSELTARYEGMQTRFAYKPLAAQSEIHVYLEATGSQLASYLPSSHSTRFCETFGDDLLTIEASVTPYPHRLALDGTCKVSPTPGVVEQLDFGIDFDLLFRHTPLLRSWEREALPPWLLTLVDCRWNPAAAWSQGSCTGMRLCEGWIEAKELPLARYAPVLAQLEPYISVEGQGNFKGRFNSREIEVEYEGRDVRFLHPMFEVEVESIGDLKSSTADRRATQKIDLISGKQIGTIPVFDSHCWIRRGDLLFDRVDGHVIVENGQVRVKKILAQGDGIDFEGSLHLDRTDPQGAKLHLCAPLAQGPVSCAQHMCARYSDMVLWDLPIQGKVHTCGDGLNLYFQFLEEETYLDITVSGNIEHAEWQNREGSLRIGDTSLLFSYDHHPQKLVLRDIEGDLHTAEGETLLLHAPELQLCDVERALGSFDMALYAQDRECIRLVGSCLPFQSQHDTEEWRLSIDEEKTHIGSLSPHIAVCRLKDWSTPSELSAEVSVNLSCLDEDLRLLRTIHRDLPYPEALQAVLGEGSYGEITMRVEVDRNSPGTWDLTAESKNLTLRHHPIEQFSLTGTGCSRSFELSQLRADDFTASGSFHWQEDTWRVDPLRLYGGDWGYAHLAGALSDKSKQGEIVLSEVWLHLDQLHNLPWLTSWTPTCPLKGELSISGAARFDLQVEDKAKLLQSMTLFLAPNEIGIRELSCGWEKPIALQWENSKFVLGSTSLTLRPEPSETTTSLEWDWLAYSPVSQELEVAPLSFRLPVCHTDWACREIARLANFDLSEEVITLVQGLHPQADLIGEIEISSAGSELRLQSDNYQMGSLQLDLSNPRLTLSRDQVQIASGVRVGRRQLGVDLRAGRGDWYRGCAVLYDDTAGLDRRPLTLEWWWPEGQGLHIETAEGSLAGVALQLDAASDSEHLFRGTLSLENSEAFGLLPRDAEGVLKKFNLGAGYKLEGVFGFDESWKPCLFKGSVSAHDASLGSARLDHVSAQLYLTPDYLLFSDLHITDRSGAAHVDRLCFWKPHGELWAFSAGRIAVGSITPATTRLSEGVPKALRPVHIPCGELRNFRGWLGDKQTWTGAGFLRFDTSPNRNTSNPAFFAIPAEVLGRIGLEPGNMTPAKGTIGFEVAEGRCYINHLHDLYSRNQHSQFFLAKDCGRSFVDFDGNVQIAMRTKQYNLLLKFTEMFLISVGGKVNDPSVSLQEDAVRRQRRLQATCDPRSATFPMRRNRKATL